VADPARAAGLVSQADMAAQQRRMTELPVLYARALGLPVIFVNQVGPWAGRHIIIPLDIAAGRLSYTISRERRRKARAAAEPVNDPADMIV